MRGDDAYAVLGLRPGAGRAEIDQAYRRLIKRYHPDYTGGDGGRAAELNRAYSVLRDYTRQGSPAPAPAPSVQQQLYARPPSRWRRVAFGAAAVAAAVLLARTGLLTESDSSWPQFSSVDVPRAAGESPAVRPSRQSFSLDEPLATELIDTSVGDAIRLHGAREAVVAAEFSRNCLSRLSANPSVALFDSCAAYDEAITVLAAGNPAFESGPFNPSAVTARQVGAARLLSADYFEAESRLQQIRSRVHLVLLPRIPDVGRPRDEGVSAAVPHPQTVEVPLVEPAAPPPLPRVEPRRAPTPPRAAIRPPGRRAAPQPRPTPSARRVAAPAPPARRAAPPSTRKAKPRPAPAWQQPIKPAWQRPLPPPKD